MWKGPSAALFCHSVNKEKERRVCFVPLSVILVPLYSNEALERHLYDGKREQGAAAAQINS